LEKIDHGMPRFRAGGAITQSAFARAAMRGQHPCFARCSRASPQTVVASSADWCAMLGRCLMKISSALDGHVDGDEPARD